MDYKELATAVKLCGNEPNAALCEKCPYWSGLDMSKCIPRMTADAATAITDLLARAEAAEALAEKAEMERGAAVARIKEDHWCEDCKFQPTYSLCKNDGNCEECESPCFCEHCKDGSLWEWRGQKEE